MGAGTSWRRGVSRSLGPWAAPVALSWQASLGSPLLGDPSTAEVLAALTWPGEEVALGWVQLPDQCGKAGGLGELVLHEMNANSRGDGGGGGIPVAVGS